MATPNVTPDKPFEVTLGDGSVVKGANLEEAFRNLQSMKENASAEIKRMRDENERLREDFTRQQQQVRPPEPDTGKFSNQRYYELLNTDPIAAQNYMDQHRFGVADPVAAFNGMRAQVDSITQQSVAAAFTAMHAEDFPATQEAARALTRATEELVNSGFPYNIDTVNYAYNRLVGDGTIKPLERNTQDDTQAPPPVLTGSTGELGDEYKSADSLSDADLEKLLRSKGLLR